MSDTPGRHGVVAVLRRGERWLWIRRGPGVRYAGYWAPPSGKVEPQESQADAVVREVREELGLEVRALRKVWESRTDDGLFALHWWLVAEEGGALEPDPREVAEVRWLRVAEMRQLDPHWESDLEFYETAAQRLDD